MRNALATIIFAILLGLVPGCKDDSSGSPDGGGDTSTDTATQMDSDADSDTDIDTDADTDTDIDADTDTDTDTGSTGTPKTGCEPLIAPTGNVIDVTSSQAGELQSIVSQASSGDTISLADGTYALDGDYLWFGTSGVTLRSASGNREAVVLDGNYQTSEIITVAASDVTIADITIQRAYTHPIHVISTDLDDTLNTRIYNVHIIDPREQAIKVNPHEAQIHFTDHGEVACSHLELTDDGRPNINPTSGGCYTGGVDAHQSTGWVIRDNRIEGFWCENGLAEHAVHLWRGCRDTVVERNILVDNARGVGFGLAEDGDARTYNDNPCPGAGYVGHYDGIIRNNFIFASRAELFSSADGFDCGVCLWSACGAKVLHNTIVSTGDNFSSIEWRFQGSTRVEVFNNIVTHPLRQRGSASGREAANLTDAALGLFVDGPGGDLHLAPTASDAINQGMVIPSNACTDDIDGELRDQTPDIGADERY